ncbi:thioredoxin reductase, partial [Burkholderia sp. COPS]
MGDTCQVCQVNPAITDAVTQVNVKVVAEAPAMAMGSLYQ